MFSVQFILHYVTLHYDDGEIFRVRSSNKGSRCYLTFGRKSSFSIWIVHHRLDPPLKCHHNNASELAAASVFLQLCGVKTWQ